MAIAGSTGREISKPRTPTSSNASRWPTPITSTTKPPSKTRTIYTRPWKITTVLYRRKEKNAQLNEFKCVEFAEQLIYGDLKKRSRRFEYEALSSCRQPSRLSLHLWPTLRPRPRKRLRRREPPRFPQHRRIKPGPSPRRRGAIRICREPGPATTASAPPEPARQSRRPGLLHRAGARAAPSPNSSSSRKPICRNRRRPTLA